MKHTYKQTCLQSKHTLPNSTSSPASNLNLAQHRRLRSMFPYASGSEKPGICHSSAGHTIWKFPGRRTVLLRLPGRSASFLETILRSRHRLRLFHRSIRADDAYLAAAADAGSGIRILRQDLWEMMITFLISQQKTIPKIREAVEAWQKNTVRREPPPCPTVPSAPTILFPRPKNWHLPAWTTY